MSDIVLDAIKSFLYERQEHEEGRLDGTLYLLKGQINLDEKINFKKSIYPTYLIIQRYRDDNRNIYYKTLVNKNEKEVFLLRLKEPHEKYYFHKSTGSIYLIMNIFQKLRDQQFTFIIDGNCIPPFVVHVSTMNYEYMVHAIHLICMDILTHFDNINFELHQRYNLIV